MSEPVFYTPLTFELKKDLLRMAKRFPSRTVFLSSVEVHPFQFDRMMRGVFVSDRVLDRIFTKAGNGEWNIRDYPWYRQVGARLWEPVDIWNGPARGIEGEMLYV